MECVQESIGLFWDENCSGRNDQHVIGDRALIAQMNKICIEIDMVDLALAVRDAIVQLGSARSDDLIESYRSKGNEQESWLIDVAVVLVDDGDFYVTERTPKPIRRERATGSGPKDHDVRGHTAIVRTGRQAT